MAYNPFDDVIDQDPAYMAKGGGTRAGLVQPLTTDQGPRYISSGIAKAYSLLTPEEKTLQEIEKNNSSENSQPHKRYKEQSLKNMQDKQTYRVSWSKAQGSRNV